MAQCQTCQFSSRKGELPTYVRSPLNGQRLFWDIRRAPTARARVWSTAATDFGNNPTLTSGSVWDERLRLTSSSGARCLMRRRVWPI
jgi:hypothetical protein